MLAQRGLVSVGTALLLALAASVSCGGSTRDGGTNGGSSGQSGAAGSAGVGAEGGAGGVVGRGGAGGASGAGAGGSVGMPALCSLPAEAGNCLAYAPSFFHNPATGVCEPFVYGGCGGNDNRFESREACQAACRGGRVNMDACTLTSDCMPLEIGCCGSCEQGDNHSFVAINRMKLAEFAQTRTCPGIACGACPAVDEVDTTSQYFGATCSEGACTIVDVRETPATQCMRDEDCELRDGVACCNGCDGRGLVSVRPQAFSELLCADVPEPGCPPCAPIIPPEFTSLCTNGRCVVSRRTL